MVCREGWALAQVGVIPHPVHVIVVPLVTVAIVILVPLVTVVIVNL